ncbi:alpha-L-arabinofuranosidase C-terminal domain-containing protein [Pontibacter sp. 13R65]
MYLQIRNKHVNCQKLLMAFAAILFSLSNFSTLASQPDSAYVFAYATTKNEAKNGLHFAWSVDKKQWNAIGPEERFMPSDYGRWGAEKRMYRPFLFQDNNKQWHCLFTVNDRDGVFAHAASADLVNWKPQDYPEVIQGNNCTELEAHYDPASGLYKVSWLSTKGGNTQAYEVSTKDFKNYSKPAPMATNKRLNSRVKVIISGSEESGTLKKVPWSIVDGLIKAHQLMAYNAQLAEESYHQDPVKFKDLKPVEVKVTADAGNSKQISDLLMGIFFEDINYAADGGLYAELVENRGFEYNLHDKLGRDPSWTSKKAWSLIGNDGTFAIDSVSPVHLNNKHYAVLQTSKIGTGLVNEGFNGIAVKKGETYNFSAFVRNPEKQRKNLLVRLTDQHGGVIGKTTIKANSPNWEKVKGVIIANNTIKDARLEIIPQATGSIALDMISLFPQNTFKGHSNGLRADLAQTVADLKPRFVRFPGGCVAHGDGIHNIYKWKNTIGPLEARKPDRNLWGYQQSFGLGFYEYFQYCEDIGATPVPVIAAGVPCQNSGTGGAGQQGGVPLEEMDEYIQDILDLIEYSNGDAKSTWGKKRAEAGHPKPFNLKYIGIGNEDLISDVFKERFAMIYKAIKEKHPEITVIGTVGPFSEGSDYREGWAFATELGVPVVDEHYYQSPGWFINNQDFYDKYDRSKSKVYLGEYASKGNALYNALSEAIYLTALERNGDVVEMASYAPLLAKEQFTQWGTDLIFFNNTEIKPTPSYEVQKLYGQYAGDMYINSDMAVSNNSDAVQKRIGVSVVRNSKSGDVFVRMVNLLPVEAKANLNLQGLAIGNQSGRQTVLSGQPGDKVATPVTTELKVGDNFDVTLPPYSFVLIQMNKAEKKSKK